MLRQIQKRWWKEKEHRIEENDQRQQDIQMKEQCKELMVVEVVKENMQVYGFSANP